MALARRCRHLAGSKRNSPGCLGYGRRHGFATNPLNLHRLRDAPHGSSVEVTSSTDDGDIPSEPISLDEGSPLFQRVLTGRDMEELPAGHKAGYVTLLGKPNAGKSTLLNAMVGQKLSIVTFKAQTTRHRVLGIVSEPQYQMVLQDTPGVISKKTNKLDQRMMAAVRRSVNDSDALLALVDLSLKPKEALDMIQLPPNWKGPPMAVVLNKEDLVTAEEAQQMKAWYEANCRCSRVMLASAMVGSGVQEVQEWAVQHLPESPAFYPKDMITEQPEKFFVAEIVREKIFLQYRQEIPYCTTVNVLEFRERPLGQKCFVKVEVLCERESQKGMIIGKGGSALKRLAMAARVDIEAFLEAPVFLEVKVRSSSKWRADDDLLKAYGY